MNNRKIRRGLSLLLLLLVFALQLAMVASAESFVTWVGSNGYAQIATVTKNPNVLASRNVAITSTKVYHTEGTTNYFVDGNYRIEYTSRFGFPSNYSSYLTSAATKEGMKETYSATQYMTTAGGYAVVVPASQSSGYYCITAEIFGYVGTYKVQESGVSGLRTLVSGDIAFAPATTAGVITGYAAVP